MGAGGSDHKCRSSMCHVTLLPIVCVIIIIIIIIIMTTVDHLGLTVLIVLYIAIIVIILYDIWHATFTLIITFQICEAIPEGDDAGRQQELERCVTKCMFPPRNYLCADITPFRYLPGERKTLSYQRQPIA